MPNVNYCFGGYFGKENISIITVKIIPKTKPLKKCISKPFYTVLYLIDIELKYLDLFF